VPTERRLSYARDRCDAIAGTVTVQVDDRPVAMNVGRTALTFPAGSAGLHTSRLTCALSSTGDLPTVGSQVDYRITANADRVGWREVVAVPSGVRLAGSDVPQRSVTDELTRYPAQVLSSPLDRREAHLSVEAGHGPAIAPDALRSGAASVLPDNVDGFTTAFTDLVTRQELGLGFVIVAVLAAMALGALHAFAPGHGKTVMAADLVGREGSLRQAVVVALSVTATHTLGVLALGVALTGAGLAAPERVYPWLGTASGLLLAGIGAGLLLRHTARGPRSHEPGGQVQPIGNRAGAHEHEEVPTINHRHGLFSHSHQPHAATAGTTRGLVAVGFAGGLVPSPSALLVLLGGVALGRAWLGVLLVVAYGAGMAITLVATGALLVFARDALNRLLGRTTASVGARRAAVLLGRGLPVVTATVVVVVGLGIALRSAAQI
jgi:ABC-type nickel/cobalt efflux system permease component RcnA